MLLTEAKGCSFIYVYRYICVCAWEKGKGKREKVRQMGMQKQRKGREAKGEGSDQLHANDYWDFFISILFFFPMSTVENKRIVKYLVAGLDFTLMQNFLLFSFPFIFYWYFLGLLRSIEKILLEIKTKLTCNYVIWNLGAYKWLGPRTQHHPITNGLDLNLMLAIAIMYSLSTTGMFGSLENDINHIHCVYHLW